MRATSILAPPDWRTSLRTIRLLAALVVAAAASIVVAPAASALPNGYYSVPYSDVLIQHYHFSDGSTMAIDASYSSWQRDGFPAPRPAPVHYVKYPWSPAIYAVSFFDGNRDDWYWERLTFQQWQRAGSPAASNAGWIEGSDFYKWASSGEIFVEAPDRSVHKLTWNEWAASGFYPPTTDWSRGFYKYPWSGSIGYIFDAGTGAGYPISYQDWAAEDFPTPMTVNHVNGEEVWKFRSSSQLYLDSAIVGGWYALTGPQWTALGRPSPLVY